jgi:hypothetical protein
LRKGMIRMTMSRRIRKTTNPIEEKEPSVMKNEFDSCRQDFKSRRSRPQLGPSVMTALFLLLTVLSCQDRSDKSLQGRPAAERTSVHYMLPTVNAAHEEVIKAANMLQEDSPDIDAVIKSLDKSARNLANLEWFYVPATEARENVYNAYLEHLAGHADECNTYLDSALLGLLRIAERSSSHVEPYIRELTQRIESVQLHIREGAPVDEELKSLCEFFQLHLLKAQLVIDEHAFDVQKTGD